MSDGTQNLESKEDPISIESDNNKNLLERTRRWVNERSLPKMDMIKHPGQAARLLLERNARAQIQKEIEKDLKTHGLANSLNAEGVARRATSVGEDPKIVAVTDALGKSFYHVLRKEGDEIIAEERESSDLSAENNLISQVRLNPHGRAELTLDFRDERYVQRDANPNIQHSISFPNAAVRVFDTLALAINESSSIK